MTPEQLAKIESAVFACLDNCRNSDEPFSWLERFLQQLKADSWTDAEIVELQTRVIRVLLYRERLDAD